MRIKKKSKHARKKEFGKEKCLKVAVALICPLVFSLSAVRAQEVISTSGADAEGNGGTVSYTVGQTVYNFTQGPSGSETQGVQQPYEISTVTNLEEPGINTLQCIVYPNPANHYVMLRIEGEIKEQYTALLYDLNGQLLGKNDVSGNETRIELDHLKPAIYLLKLICLNREIKTFKLIKSN